MREMTEITRKMKKDTNEIDMNKCFRCFSSNKERLRLSVYFPEFN